MRRLGCWLLAAGLVVLGCLAASGCSDGGLEARTSRACIDAGGIPTIYHDEDGWTRYQGCDFPPQPCGPLPAEVP